MGAFIVLRGRLALMLVVVFAFGWAAAEDVAPAGEDIAAYINSGHYDFSLGGDSVWNSQVFINTTNKSALTINGNFHTIALRAGGISLLRDFSVNNSVTINNTIFRPSDPYPSTNDYLIGIATGGVTTNLYLSGTTFDGFSRSANRGASVLYAYASGAVVNVFGGDSAANALTFRNNRSEWDAGGAVAVSYASLYFNDYVTFENNYTGNYGGAITVYDYANLLQFDGVTRFAGNHSSIFGGAIDVWGGAATVVFNGETTFEGNYVDYEYYGGNSYERPRHVNDQHVRGGAINIGYIASSGANGTRVTFNGVSRFANNYVISRGANANNRNALGGAISVYGNNQTQDYRLAFTAAAVFDGNFVYSQNGQGHGGAIYYDTGGATLNMVGGTQFLNNYASTHGGAIYLQEGEINLHADTDDIVFQGNRHGAEFTASGSTYRPVAGSGTPNAIYLGSGGELNFNTDAGRTIHFHDPIASIAGSQVEVTKSGLGEVIFYGDNGATDLYNSNIQANTTVEAGLFTLADGVEYGSANYGIFTVQNTGTVRGGGGGALNANTLAIQSGGALGAAGGVFTVNANSVTLANGSRLTGSGTVTSATSFAMTGTIIGDTAAGENLSVDALLTGAGGIDKSGEGSLTLARANTYTGATTVTGGTLAGGIAEAFAASSSVTVGSGGTLDTNGFNQTANNLNGSGALRLTGADLVAVLDSDQEFSGQISGTGGLGVRGGSTLTITGDNSYSGTTSITENSTVVATHGNALGSGLVLGLLGSTLELRYATDQVFANRLAGGATVLKTGAGTAHITGGGSRIDEITVAEGEFSLEQNGVFWTERYTTAQNATTSIASGSKLYAAESFTQAAGSTLNVQVGNNEPAITGISASIDGNLNVTGFTSGPLAAASQVDDVAYTIIRTSNGITGNFAVAAVDDSGISADYLTITGGLTNGNLEYTVGLGLTWNADTNAHGTFTLSNADDVFDIDVVLADRGQTFPTGWNGNTLTKAGFGTLTLSSQNTYSGATTIQAGTLAAGAENVLDNSSDTTVATGATLDLNGFDQTVNNLSGGGSVILDGAELTTVYNQDASLGGNLSGGGTFIKDGANALTLSGTNSHGATVVRQGNIIVTNATALGAGAVDIETNGRVDLVLSGAGTIANQLSGAGTLRNLGPGVATLTGAGSTVGAAQAVTGELAFGQNGVFQAGSYRTSSGATTSIGETARLNIGGAFVQESGSFLNVAIGQNNEPAITADSAQLAGTLTITGFETDMFRAASRFTGNSYDVVRTTQQMASGFNVVDIGTVARPADYLTVGGFFNADRTVYSVGFTLTWYTGPDDAHGTFTIADGDVFNVDGDIALEDQTGPFVSGWNGRDLTKAGNGTLILSSVPKTYTGSTTVEAGILAAGVDNAFASSESVVVQSAGTLALQGTTQTARNLEGEGEVQLGGGRLNVVSASATEFEGIISGAGSVGKSGTADFTLSGDNTYESGTFVTQGRLVAASASALGTGAVSVADNASLRLGIAGGGTVANTLSGAGTLEKAGTDTVRLTGANSSIGRVDVAVGNLTLAQTGVMTAGDYTTRNTATTALESGAQLTVTGQFTQENTASLAVAVGTTNNPAIRAGSAQLGGNLDVTGFGGDVFTRSSAIPTELYTVVSSDTAIGGDFSTVTIDSTAPVEYLTLAGTFSGDRKQYYVGLGLTWNASTDRANGTFNVTDAFTVDTVLRDRSGETFISGWNGQDLIKNGTGTLTLAADNTYGGSTTVNAGTLVLQTYNTIQSSSAVTVNAGATLQLAGTVQTANNLTGGGTVALGGTNLTSTYTGADKTFSGQMSGTGRFIKSGTGQLTLSGSNTHSGGTTVSGGRLVASNYDALGTGGINIGSAGILELALGTSDALDNLLSGGGQLVKTGAGITTLTAAGSSVGAVDVQAGTLALTQTGAFSAAEYTIGANAATSISGNSWLDVSAGSFTMAATTSTLMVTVGPNNQPAVQANAATLNGILNITGFRTEDGQSRASAFIGNEYEVVRSASTINGNFTQVNLGTAASPAEYLTLEGDFNVSQTSYFIRFGLSWNASAANGNGTFNLANEDERFVVDVNLADRTGIIFDSGWNGRDLTKQGDGTLVLAYANEYTGETNIQAGTLEAGVANAFANSEEVTVASGATLDMNGYSQTAQNLSGAGNITLGNGNATLTVESDQTGNPAYSGIISGNGNLRKTGQENLILSGRNTYTGTTHIAHGSIIASNGDSLSRGNVTVESGGELRLDFGGDETVYNTVSGAGVVNKSGLGTARLTGEGSSVGAVTVDMGELSFEQDGVFRATSLATNNNAITSIGPQSQLIIAGELWQRDANSILNVTTGTENDPVIQADTAQLAGTLNISGFSSQTYDKASVLPDSAFTIIKTANGITGDFTSVVIGNTIDPIDYLAVKGGVSADGKNYDVGVQLAWNAGNDDATGTFTISGTDTFEVDEALSNQSNVPAGNPWDGRSLTKMGTGTLILSSSDNSYTGNTDIQAGTLRTGADNVFDDSSSVNVAEGAVLDTGKADGQSWYDQTAKQLTGDGSIILGGNNTLTVGSTDPAVQNSVFSGTISGDGRLRKVGTTSSLLLSGENDYSGGTSVDGGTLILQRGTSAGTGSIATSSGSILQLDIAGGQTETFDNSLSGTGGLNKTGAGTAELTGGGTIGDVIIQGGTLALRQNGALQVADYTTETGATTDIGAQSQLDVAGTYRQETNATLQVAIGSANEPAIRADDANLDGNLVITGFDTSTFRSASDILGRNFVVVESGSSLLSGFQNTTIESAGVEVDFLTITGRINPDPLRDNQYIVGFDLKWNANDGTAIGDFTLAEGEVFDVDRALDTNMNPAPNWDGNTLTKKGEGTLILSAENGYVGNTNVNSGTLRMGIEDAIANSAEVAVAAGATFDLNGFDQNVKSIAGTGSILLGDGILSVGQAGGATSSDFDGTISGTGGLRVDGSHTLTLSGDSDFSGGTTIADGTLILQSGSAAGTGGINAAGGTLLQLDVATAQTFANTLSGTGTVEKTGVGTAILTGENSSVGDVEVSAGSITLAQNGDFTAENYEIQANAGTTINSSANLKVTDNFFKDDAASLLVAIGTEPSIEAARATIGGTLSISGFDASALPASVLTQNRHTVLQTAANGITGNFSSVDFGGQLADVDYLVLDGELNSTSDAYTVGFGLAWNAGQAEGTGSFTIADGTSFNVDVTLEDKDANGPFASGWNGRDLTKRGGGTLILSERNTYTGATTVNGGTLQVTVDGALGRTESLTVADGATFDITDSSQTVGFVDAQIGSVLEFGEGTLVVDSSEAPGGRRDNIINGTLQGSGSINLTNADLTVTSDNSGYSGDVNASYSSLSTTGSTITLENAHGLGDSGTITLRTSDDSLVFAAAAQTGTFSKSIAGQGTVALEDGTDITISGDNSAFTGDFTVDTGATMRAGAANNLGTADIQVDGALHLSSAANSAWRLDNTVTGAGDFVKDGDGILIVGSSMAAFDGNSRVATGTLIVGDDTDTGAVLGSPQVAVDAGATLSGTGRVTGPVANSGVIASLNSIAGYESAAPSNLTIGRLVNDGRLRLAGGSVGNTLTVQGGMESQNGVLEINTVLGDDSSPTDKLILDGGSTTGTTGVVVHNRGGVGAQTDVGIMIVEARNGATTSTDAFALSSSARNFRIGAGTVAAGAFDYSLVRGGEGGEENSWYLVSRQVARPEAGNYLISREAAEGLFFHTMYDRLLGYQEYTDPATGDRRLGPAWARMEYAHSTQKEILPGMKTTTRTFVAHTGMDLWRAESNLGVFSAGAMIGFGHASGEINSSAVASSAKANVNGYVVGGYATWFADRRRLDGLYVDAWFQHGWFRNGTSGAGLPGEHFNSRLWSGSLEVGYALPLFKTASSAWSVIPTVQATYNRYEANDFVEAGGTVISYHDRDRFRTRAGVRVKGRIDSPGRLPLEPYMELNWLHQGKQAGLSMNQDHVSLRSPRNMYEAKLGIDAEMRKNLRVGLGLSGQVGKNNHWRLAGQIGLRLDW